MDPDGPLVEQARQGQQEAFTELVRRYERKVINLARSLTANDADADDLAQEVFIRVFRGLRGFRGDSAFRTWLYRVAVNVIRSQLRRRAFFGLLRAERTTDPAAELERLAAAGNLEESVARRDAIDRALARLPSNLGVAVTLRDIQGLEYKEIAVVLGVPVGTVMSRIARGRQRLRPMLAGLAGRSGRRGAERGTEAGDADLQDS